MKAKTKKKHRPSVAELWQSLPGAFRQRSRESRDSANVEPGNRDGEICTAATLAAVQEELEIARFQGFTRGMHYAQQVLDYASAGRSPRAVRQYANELLREILERAIERGTIGR